MINDPDGKSFFAIPSGSSPEEMREAVLTAYIVNGGTGYGKAGCKPGVRNDFPETPYSAAEAQRIADRQQTNTWSYHVARVVADSGGALVATPNGILMGIAGSPLHSPFSQRGGTMWGDLFLLNIGTTHSAERLRDIVRSGRMWYRIKGAKNAAAQGGIALDRVLHHEERHAQQWAARGFSRMVRDYAWELFRENALGMTNRLEKDAGLHDGGYR